MKTTPNGDLPPQDAVDKSEIRIIGGRTVAVTMRNLDERGALKPIEKRNQARWGKKDLKEMQRYAELDAQVLDVSQEKLLKIMNGDAANMWAQSEYTGNEVERP